MPERKKAPRLSDAEIESHSQSRDPQQEYASATDGKPANSTSSSENKSDATTGKERCSKRYSQKNTEIICSLQENLYICCRNNANNRENIYSEYILVVALFTSRTVVRNAALCIYIIEIFKKKACRKCDRPFFFFNQTEYDKRHNTK